MVYPSSPFSTGVAIDLTQATDGSGNLVVDAGGTNTTIAADPGQSFTLQLSSGNSLTVGPLTFGSASGDVPATAWSSTAAATTRSRLKADSASSSPSQITFVGGSGQNTVDFDSASAATWTLSGANGVASATAASRFNSPACRAS